MAFLPGENFSGAFFENIQYGLGIVLNHAGF